MGMDSAQALTPGKTPLDRTAHPRFELVSASDHEFYALPIELSAPRVHVRQTVVLPLVGLTAFSSVAREQDKYCYFTDQHHQHDYIS
ncbi:hypothetical protein ACOMHN_063286 [Nucella lapillus]